MGMPGTINNDNWRFRLDDSGEEDSGGGGASWHEAQNVSHDFPTGELDVNVRLRMDVYVAAGDLTGIIPQLQVQINSDGFLDMNGASNVARSSASSQFVDAATTTEHGVTSTGTFVGSNSGMDEVNGEAGVGSLDLVGGEFILVEYCFQLREADLADNDVVTFRLVRGGGSGFDTSATATCTIDLPAATIINQVATATLTLAPLNAGINASTIINQVATDALTLTPLTAQLVRTFNQTATAALTLTPLNANVNAAIVIDQVAAAALTLTPLNADVSFGFNINQTATAVLNLTPLNATVVFDTIVNQVATAPLTLTPLNANVNAAIVIDQATTAALALTALDAAVSYDVIVNQTAPGVLNLTPLNAGINASTIINQVATSALNLTPLNAGVNASIVIDQVGTATLTLTPLDGTIVFGPSGTVINQTATGTLNLTPFAATLSISTIINQRAAAELTFNADDDPRPATLNLVWQNWGFLIDNMTWEGGKIIEHIVRWDDPPGSPSNHHFWHAFFTGPDERSVRTIIRMTDGEDYLDFWFFHYWGHTGTSQVTWDKAKPPGDIFIATFPFFRWGAGKPVRTSNWFATGFGMVDRVRLTLTGPMQGFNGPVINHTNTGALIPFFNHPPPPTGFTLVEGPTLQHQIDGMARWVTGDEREQFDSNTFRPAKPGQAAMQEHFGINGLGVDVWAGGDERESSWWHVMKKQMTSPANWVHPNTGDLVDFKSTAYNQLAIDQEGVDVNSRGWESDPRNGQNWFNATNVVPGKPDSWPTREPVLDFERWRTFTQSHWAVTPLCQYYDRHKDPGIYQIILHIVETFIGAWPTESRGASHENVGGARPRGRGMESAVMLYVVTGDSRLIDSIQYRIPLTITSLNGTVARNGNRAWEAARNDNEFSPWMAGIWGSGWLFAAQVDLPITAGEREQVIDTCIEVCQWILETAVEPSPGSGVWETPYKVEWTGSVWQDITPAPNNNFTTWEWSLPLLTWARAHHYSSFTSAEQDQLDEIYAVQVTNKTGTTNQWPESWEWVYEPAGSQAVVDIAIPVPTIEAVAEVDPDGDTVIGFVDINIPVPTITATAATKVSAVVIMHIPVPTIAADAVVVPGGVNVTASVNISIPIPTLAATASIPVKGLVDISIPVPTIAVTSTGIIKLRASTTYVANGTDTAFAIRVPYLSIDHISVLVDGETFAIGSPELTVDDEGANVTFTDAPDSGASVAIIRTTPHLPEVEFTCGAPVTPFGVSRMLTQLLYVTEEVDDQI